MKKLVLVVLLALVAPLYVSAQSITVREEGRAAKADDAGPFVTMPATVTVAAPRLGRIEIVYVGDDFRYALPTSLDVFREYDPRERVVVLRFQGDPGTYEVYAVACKAGKLSEFTRCAITITGKPPDPPAPPAPPTPPVPPDPFTKALADAYAAEADPAKARNVGLMASVFRVAPDVLDTRTDVKTTADLFAMLKTGLAVTVPPKVLPKVEAAITAELTAAFGPPSAVTALNVSAAKAELTKIATTLGGLK